MTERFLTPDEVAAILEVHPETVRRWLAQGWIPGRKLGGRWFVPEQGLADHIASRNAEVVRDGVNVPAEVGRPLGGSDLDRTEGQAVDDGPVRPAPRQHKARGKGAARRAAKPRKASRLGADDGWKLPPVVARDGGTA